MVFEFIRSWIGCLKRKRNNDDDEEAMDDDRQLHINKKPRSTENGWKHEVFLSFRGDDTRNGFTSHLHAAMVRAGIDVFIDDQKLRKGKFIKPELLNAIDASKYAVVVLSTNYASSKWCLEELARIVQRMVQGKLEVVPVFYKVDPSHVRHQSGSFRKAFAGHQRDRSVSRSQVKGWRDAFKRVGMIAGHHIKGDCNESEEVSKIVQRLDEELRTLFFGDGNQDLVGIEQRAEEVIKLLCLQSEDVRFLVIHGMSGSGKTTLAEFVYRKIKNQFEGSNFVLGINDASVESHYFCELQEKVLRGIFNDRNIHIANVVDGVSEFQRRLRGGSKVLLVLDDVNHVDQFKSLAGDGRWYGDGSRVILTTTNKDVLITDRSVEFCDKYECKLLNNKDAYTLFCLKAFGTQEPKQGFEKLTSEILMHLDGLPLAINVIGSSMWNQEDVRFWEETKEMLSRCCFGNVILKRLGVGYHRLDNNEKEIFMYMACYFYNNNRWYIYANSKRQQEIFARTMEDIGLHPRLGITNLIKRSFLSRFHNVHNPLQQMCWEMIRQESPNKPRKRKALNSCQDIQEILSSEKGSETIRIINDELDHEAYVPMVLGDPKCFLKMTKLVVLCIKNKVDFSNGLSFLPNQLRILEWWYYPLKSFPPTFQPKHLVELRLHGSRLEKLWENFSELPNLIFIDLSGSKDLVEVPDLSMAPRLLTLHLYGCSKLVEIHRSVFVHRSLFKVDLSGCSRLESLGCNEIDMKHLESLCLDWCSNLQMIPGFGETTQNLKELRLKRTRVEKLPESLGRLCSLTYLNANGSPVKELPSSICLLNKLKELDLRGTNLATLPTCIDDICRSIKTLRLDGRKNLISLPKLPKSRNSSRYYKDQADIDFHYVASETEFIVSKPRNKRGNYLLISCLICPGLFENKRGEDAAVTLLKKYLEVGSIFKVIPHASFELYTSTKISEWFEYHNGNGNTVTMKLPSGWCDDSWIGIALCASIHGRPRIQGGRMVARIHSGKGKMMSWIPTKLLDDYSGYERQLVRYVSVDKYVRQAIDWPEIDELHISFHNPDHTPTAEYAKVKSCAARMIYKTDLDDFANPCRFTETFERIVENTKNKARDKVPE